MIHVNFVAYALPKKNQTKNTVTHQPKSGYPRTKNLPTVLKVSQPTYEDSMCGGETINCEGSGKYSRRRQSAGQNFEKQVHQELRLQICFPRSWPL